MPGTASLGDSNSRMLMAPIDGFLSHGPGRTENQHNQNFNPHHGHAPWLPAHGLAHSITSSARASSVGGTSRPIALAVCRLMMSSNLLARKTGRSAGFSPLRISPV